MELMYYRLRQGDDSFVICKFQYGDRLPPRALHSSFLLMIFISVISFLLFTENGTGYGKVALIAIILNAKKYLLWHTVEDH